MLLQPSVSSGTEKKNDSLLINKEEMTSSVTVRETTEAVVTSRISVKERSEI